MNLPDDVRQAILICCISAEQCGYSEGYDWGWAEAVDELTNGKTPEPDWSDAPEWAMWMAANPDGKWHISELKPRVNPHGFWDAEGKCALVFGPALPLGIDWRTTLRKRPEATE